jgi:energy-coupling factor transport system ATP-binding protein
LQHLNGLLRPQAGQVRVLGRDLGAPGTDLRRIRRSVGLVFQRPEDQIFEQYVGDDVAYGPRLVGMGKPELRERVRWALELVGLEFERYVDRMANTLSGGERRKVGLAGVLALRPQVLLLDEPTAGLDPQARADLLDRLSGLHDRGMTLLIATHNMDDVAALADRVYVLEKGRVALHGPTRQVFSQVDRLRTLGLGVPAAVTIMAAFRDRVADLPVAGPLGPSIDVPIDMLTLGEAERAILGALSRLDHRKGPRKAPLTLAEERCGKSPEESTP